MEREQRNERRVFGEHEVIELPVDAFVRLPQVRSGMNPELANIKDSIAARELINPIDVARMSPTQLHAYIAFVNQVWGTAVEEQDYAQQLQSDGRYYVVVAGHTRTEAIHQLQHEASDREYCVVAKVHSVTDPEEIIALQLDENLHSKPAQEQRAIAIVETYQYGLQSGLWHNKAEFLAQSQGKFSRQILNDAIGFAQLPPTARDFVFSGKLSYNAGVALGRAVDTIADYAAARLGYETAPEEVDAELEQAVRQQIGLLIAGITNRKLNGTAAKKYIAGQISLMHEQMGRLRSASEEEALFEFVSPEQQRSTYLRQLEREYRAALRDMRETSVSAVTGALELHRKLAGSENIDGLDAERRRRIRLLAATATELEVDTYEKTS